jgi:predicted nucleic acid-binding protein
MQKVVSNSSPIIHLAKIGKLSLLREYFNTIMVPESVFKECVAEGKDRKEVEAIKKAEWIRVAEVQDKKLVKLLQSSLDDGESEAIALSLESGADLILLDDSDAREKARIYGLTVTGTLGVLLRAKKDRKISSLKENIIKLRESGFWVLIL